MRLWVATTDTSSKETRMQLHANAALGLAGRRRLVGLIEQGHSIRAAAAALSVAPATAHRWWARWAEASEPETLSARTPASLRPMNPGINTRQFTAATRRSFFCASSASRCSSRPS